LLARLSAVEAPICEEAVRKDEATAVFKRQVSSKLTLVSYVLHG
jgi:hypothetical protein